MQNINIKDSQFNIILDRYRKGQLSLGQVAQILHIDHEKLIKILSASDIDIIEYDFKDDLKHMDSFKETQ